ncbi:MAG: glycoside hydrolase family 3 protein [Ruminiclostridium sp.]|nr:glycoside hydrolase family 3 protein [Ruminiclostridium sp.]
MNKTLDWNKYLDTAAQVVSEGIVMLKNENNALPLDINEEVAIFGRIQFDYYKSGTGSGGMVNVTKVTGIPEGLSDCGVKINKELSDVYEKWILENPFDIGEGWGGEPWSQKEMSLDDELVKRVAQSSRTALVIIGRTAGEEQENKVEEGSYLLTSAEKEMLSKVCGAFEKTVVLLNVGNLVDLEYIEGCNPDSILYVWQGGMTGGTGTAAVLTGKVSPSGKLPDTVAYSVTDYPSDPYFGSTERNFYTEDIYVGYRYFETFAKEKVRYPFGFGLSYTTFKIKAHTYTAFADERTTAALKISVKNTGAYKGKEVVQVYVEAPQGKLGKPSRVLCGYEKTRELAPDEMQELEIKIDLRDFASYDDSGITGHRFCYVLEAGQYNFYVGSDVRSAKCVWSKRLNKDIVVERLTQALAPVMEFERIKPELSGNGFKTAFEAVPMNEVDEEKRRLDNLPAEIPQTGDKGIKLSDVASGKNSMTEFIAQISDYDLCCIIRGEGMGSPRVTAGTASAFGGVSDSLTAFGIPAGCCSDGPSGMRMDCGTKAFSLPIGTLIASTFNKELVTELFTLLGLEMTANNVDCLLGPGMNIHRHPLNGRNFEYFSEDPYLTGTISAAELDGLNSVGVTGTIKHFFGNNQETNRHFLESVVSERALREIYLKGFEIAVKKGRAQTVMTTYGIVNGLWTAASFDLNTVILRQEWGFEGFTMTDWWANINQRGQWADKSNFAAMARAQNDVYMVCADGGKHNDNTLEALENGALTRAELQRNAANVLNFIIGTNAMKRLMGEETAAEVINRPEAEAGTGAPANLYEIDGELTLSAETVKGFENICTDKGAEYSFALDVKKLGHYKITITASSTQSELAQIPVTLFTMGTAAANFTWNGTGGKPVSIIKEINMFSAFTSIRLYFAQSGLTLDSIKIEFMHSFNDEKFDFTSNS